MPERKDQREFVKMQIEMDSITHADLKALQEKLGMRTLKELLNQGIDMLFWAARKSEEGKLIVAKDQEGNIAELSAPLFTNLRRRSKTSGE